MPYLLGIHIGESAVTAAVCLRRARPPHGDPAAATGPAQAAWGAAQPVTLGSSTAAVPSALLLSPGGGLVAAGDQAGYPQQGEQATGFLRRVGDDVPIQFADRALPAPALMAGMVGWTLGRLWQQQAQAPERIAVAHPTGWGPHRIGLLRAALDDAGLDEPAMVPRAGAVVTAFQAGGQLPPHATVLLVFRLGGTSLEVSLVSLHLSGQYELIASNECTDLGGADLDAADAAGQRALLQAGVDLAARTVAACRIPVTELTAVLLAGGAARHPLLADLLSSRFAVPVLRSGDPQLTVACGAALSVRPRTPRASNPAAVVASFRDLPAPAVVASFQDPPAPAVVASFRDLSAPAVVAPFQDLPAAAVASFQDFPAPDADRAEPITPGPQAALPPPRPPIRVSAAPVGRR